jgi:hypothetical protein
VLQKKNRAEPLRHFLRGCHRSAARSSTSSTSTANRSRRSRRSSASPRPEFVATAAAIDGPTAPGGLWRSRSRGTDFFLVLLSGPPVVAFFDRSAAALFLGGRISSHSIPVVATLVFSRFVFSFRPSGQAWLEEEVPSRLRLSPKVSSPAMGMGALAASHYAEERRPVCRPAYTRNPIANPCNRSFAKSSRALPGRGPVGHPKPPWRALS